MNNAEPVSFKELRAMAHQIKYHLRWFKLIKKMLINRWISVVLQKDVSEFINKVNDNVLSCELFRKYVDKKDQKN